MKFAYARWEIQGTELPSDLQDIHISCGVGDEQYDCFDLNRPESKLTITGNPNGYDIELKVFSDGLENEEDYWLSPCTLDDVEAKEFGIEEF